MVNQEPLFNRVRKELAKRGDTATAGGGKRQADSVQHVAHRYLKAVHKVVFDSPNVKNLADAKARHKDCVDAMRPDDVEEET